MVKPPRTKRGRRYWFRLLTFFLIVIFVLPLVTLFVLANVEAYIYVRPSHNTITRPTNLPPDTHDVSFLVGDNLTLRGWYIPPKNGTVIIFLHGYFQDRTQLLFQASHLVEQGYGALLYDERGAGESDGSQRTFGWRDVADVGGALDFLHDKTQSIGVIGCSIGGQIALRAAAKYPQIQAVLADGPAMVSVEDLPPADDAIGALKLRYDWFVDRLVELHLGMAAPPSVRLTIGKIAPRPVMLFAGELGNEKAHIRLYQQAAGLNAQLWEIPGATHCDGPTAAPEEYARRMIDFFDSTLLKKPAD
ncbi:MAG: alpha/beta fold hydrolase [Anaerolineaceae bacterium]|nr:alpha/beta fold hydrolase [Anaerolineaceae bacterium]